MVHLLASGVYYSMKLWDLFDKLYFNFFSNWLIWVLVLRDVGILFWLTFDYRLAQNPVAKFNLNIKLFGDMDSLLFCSRGNPKVWNNFLTFRKFGWSKELWPMTLLLWIQSDVEILPKIWKCLNEKKIKWLNWWLIYLVHVFIKVGNSSLILWF